MKYNNIYYKLIYLDCDYEVCKQRDVKGLYKKAEAGEIKNFTGKTQAFDLPSDADLILDTEKYNIEQCVERIRLYYFI